MKKLAPALLCAIYLLSACVSSKTPAVKHATVVPAADREFRAAWVATVANINWPSKPGLGTDVQKQEALALLDFLKKHHFNAVILQVRPQCDALYSSSLEPWSYYLTGEQGKAPEPFYDPLTFWLEEAHNRGLELHVWLNPYRAHHKDGKEITGHSIVKKRPELALFLKEGYWWLDPAQQGTQDHSTAVVMDLVKRYDIDGVHFDDYFYPYPSYNGNANFPDSASWNAYVAGGGKLSRGDWRRNAVNVFIERLYRNIKSEKPHVKFGLSPFGIWRPGYPSSIQGFDQYDQLYADAKRWLNEGWIDYFTPQLYWPINRIQQSFPVLLGWWSSENTMKRHLWPGISVGRDTSARNVNEIMSQVMITRGMAPETNGVVHWSISSVTQNPNMAKALLAGPYAREALVPASPWLDKRVPNSPTVSVQKDNNGAVTVSWVHPGQQKIFRWVVYYQRGNQWSYRILDSQDSQFRISPGNGSDKDALRNVAVSAVSRTGVESRIAVIPVPTTAK